MSDYMLVKLLDTASPSVPVAVTGAPCGSSPGRKLRPSRRPDPRPASTPGGHAGERMSQRDTLVHLFAGGCGEEGYGSLYRGLTTHLVRQIPNTAIMMATYELVVYLLNG
ncbi:hypothetical protein J1605_020900 [Eschrichtius robustus]|uniref:Uncharacterized protein n=1 Tax=Eschrichtius robustus TaxID=9764 RepID=A0AB34HHW8_ESCRO|nr:hypothetical protein J1605_020900 [Eschrichtius robustus]